MKLFTPYKIGNLELKNRVIMSPMGNMLNDADNGYGEDVKAYFAERAKGGVAMIMCGGYISNKFEMTIKPATWQEPTLSKRFATFAEEIHSYGCKVCAQLVAGAGRVGGAFPGTSNAPSASKITNFWNPDAIHRAYTVDEIHYLVDCYGKAALFAKNAGADAVEFHAYGGYLPDQFMCSAWNHRTDEYGGDLNGRMRFSIEAIESIKKACGKDFPVIAKFSAVHFFENGRTIEEGIEIAKIFESIGVDALHVDVGSYETWYTLIPPAHGDYKDSENLHVKYSDIIKRNVSIPVMTSGKLGHPQFAEEILEEGKLDFVCMGRPLLADPQWVNKVRAGNVQDIRPCIGCMGGCQERIHTGRPIGCAVNPLTGRENKWGMKKADSIKKVLIVGGGPGGCETALTAADQGHDVDLWEKTAALGGNLLAAGGPEFKQSVMEYVQYLRIQIAKRPNIKVKYMHEATAAEIVNSQYDLVVLANGADPIIPKAIPGVNRENVYTSIDVLKKKRFPTGNIVVIGGGEVGIEAALHLAGQGNSVSVIEMRDIILDEHMDNGKKQLFNKMLKENHVEISTRSRLIEITDTDAVYECEGTTQSVKYDAIVLSLGLRSNNSLYEQLKETDINIVKIGDAIQPRRVMNAVWEGYSAIRALHEMP